ISTGMIKPGWPCVLALNCLQNSMMLTPCWPSSAPTGGAGFAAPAGTWRLMKPTTFIAICAFHRSRARRSPPRGGSAAAARSVSLELRVVQLDRGRPAEEADLDLHLALVVVDLLDRTAEIGERAFGDLHDLPDPERDLLPRLELLDLGREAEDLVHLLLTQRLRLLARAHELDHTLDVVDQVRGPLVEDHLDEDVARIQAPGDRDTLAVADLHDVLRRHDDVLDLLLLRRGPGLLGDSALDEPLDLVLVARVSLDRVPPRLVHHDSTREEIDDPVQDPAHRGVHEPDDQGHDDDEDDDDEGRVPELSGIRPGDLLEFFDDFPRERARPGQRGHHVTSSPYGAYAHCSAGNASSTPRARGACACSSSCGNSSPGTGCRRG